MQYIGSGSELALTHVRPLGITVLFGPALGLVSYLLHGPGLVQHRAQRGPGVWHDRKATQYGIGDDGSRGATHQVSSWGASRMGTRLSQGAGQPMVLRQEP